jgi:hypothetical protein
LETIPFILEEENQMTLRAEDFNLKATGTTGNMNKAEEYVKLMNQGVEEKNYPLYQKGFKQLVNEVRADIPHLDSHMNYKLFLFDMVSRFINEVQDMELGFTDKPFETRVGIGHLFSSPTLEVKSTETGDVVAIFENIDCFKKATFNYTKLEAIQDKRIANENRRKVLVEHLEKAQALIMKPWKLYSSEYNDFWVVEPQKTVCPISHEAHVIISRFKKLEHLKTPAGQQELTDEVTATQKELAEVQAELLNYSQELLEVESSKREFEMIRNLFQRIMSQYQLQDSTTYEQLEEQKQLQEAK